MATAGDGIAPTESGGRAREKFHEGENATTGISELEQTLKQLNFTRSKVQHPAASMENLPDELLINIFIRLLARQLAQMRSVSKCWNVLLSHPSFVKSHLHHSIHNNNQQILLVFPNYRKPFKQYSSTHLGPTNFIKRIPADLPRRVIGSVNGLICLADAFYSNIHIWNPSLSTVSAILLPPFMPPMSRYMSISMGFGFDPKTDDYKLVRLSGICDNGSVKEWLQVHIYSMRKGSWESVTQPFPSHITRFYHSDYLCVDGRDGYLHWNIETVGKTEERKILAFDLGSETFHEIPLPHSMLHSNNRMYRLRVLGGKLCEMSLNWDGSWEVWVMEEYGVPESWAKRHVLSQFTSDWRFSYGITSRSELLLSDKDDRLLLYDPVAKNTKFTRTIQKVSKIVECVDSLVWI